MGNATTCVVVLNYGHWQATCQCLDALWAMDRTPEVVVVCDNASPDDSVKRIRDHIDTHHPPSGVTFKLIENPENKGYAAGNNPGVRFGLDRGCDFIWILNNDACPDATALSALLKCQESGIDAGIVGSTLVYADASGIVQSAGGCRYNSWTTMFSANHAGRHVDEVHDLPCVALDYVSGASMFCSREVFEDVGLLSEEFFLFYEELDLCCRARKAGYSLAWCRDAVVFHEGALSIGKPGQDKDRTAIANYHENLSTLIYTKKHHPWRLPVSMSVRFLGKLCVIMKTRQWYLLNPLSRAFLDFATGRRYSRSMDTTRKPFP
ncbi:glycosyltransferase family 2 protein [Oceanidesulfovibrio indonesiensis]|uniref:Glycosyltransferase family 2 protein n=1 Tax=Oceanidesulfovibrio indonesiensis TaxID=54767 RepID=A0A7M3MEY4_9BACT|nr:glycosyltransferase family 2 protein [Oceanidesulfovibrio indonesiensis]TVM17107.1 glycosyltransferase family 2 protein [Oceanidesulfovibrio indonesiensis]